MRTRKWAFIACLFVGWSAFGELSSAQTVPPLAGWRSGDPCPTGVPNTISVLSFGAVRNDSDDDTDAMQRAADFLCQCGSGKTLLYPAGHYDVQKLTTDTEVIQPDPHVSQIAYVGCNNVSILGRSAVIDVKGDFVKAPRGVIAADFCGSGRDLVYASLYAKTPFWIADSSRVRISGFEIDGHGDETTVADVTPCYQEGSSDGVLIARTNDFSIRNMNIHRMTTDGILITARDGAVDRVTVSNSNRNALSLTEARNVRVTRSTFRDSGKVGTQPNSYPRHGGTRGVAFEPEALPRDADWKIYDDPSTPEINEDDRLPLPSDQLTYLPGNFFFGQVTVVDNLGGQMSFPHRGRGANVTVRRSTLRNPPEASRAGVLEGGIAGLYVEKCDIDASRGVIYPQFVGGGVGNVLYASAGFAAHLADMAADPSPYAQGVFREMQWFASTRLYNNTIRGDATILYSLSALPLLYVWDNTFTGGQTAASVLDTDYAFFGYALVAMGPAFDYALEPHAWTPDVQFWSNKFFVPNNAPRRDPVSGEIFFNGVSRFKDNEYSTDLDFASSPSSPPLRVTYDHIPLVINDMFPTTGEIYPQYGPLRPGDPDNYQASQPYPLSATGALNIP